MKNNSGNVSNKELEQEIINATKDINTQISSMESRFSSAEKEHDKNHCEFEKATNELREKLDNITKPFREKSDALWKEMEYCKKNISELKKNLEETEYIVCYQFYLKHEKELDEKTLTGMLLEAGIVKTTWYVGRIRKIKHKLLNGITLFRYEGDYVVYFATLGTKLIALHRTRKSEHIGDRADYEHYIGQKQFSSKNYAYQSYSFREWKFSLEISRERIDALEPINLSDETVKKTLERWLL